MIVYGGTNSQIEKQNQCIHDWSGPYMDNISRYYRCNKCFCLDYDIKNYEEYKNFCLDYDVKNYEEYENLRLKNEKIKDDKDVKDFEYGSKEWKKEFSNNLTFYQKEINFSELPDVQQTKPMIKRGIKKVGVKDIIIPLMLESINGGHYEINAKASMYGSLDDKTKGVSMSRFIQTLQKYLKRPIKYFMVCDILKDLRKTLEVKDSYIKFEFKLPINKKSPISDNSFPVYYDCRFEGKIVNNKFRFYQGVKVQYASYCPCSAELCNHLNEHDLGGYPHNQRSFCNAIIECDGNSIWLEEIIELIEKTVINVPYPILKREDEQEIARIAYENTMFVEDSIRNIANEFDKNEEIKDWYIMVDHEESIHHSNAVAIDYKGVDGGFDDRLYL